MAEGPYVAEKTIGQMVLEFRYGKNYRRRLGVKEANAFANAF